MPDELRKPYARTCPHCGKEIFRLAQKPRDLGLLLNVLLYRVPVEAEITDQWIDTARKHCRMTPERLALLRAGDHARHWPRMLQRRAARLAYFREHGELPPPWMPLLPGEPDRLAQIRALRRYRKGGLAKMKSQLRKHPDTDLDKLVTRYHASKRIRSKPRKAAALDDLMARLAARVGARTGKLKLGEFEALQSVMILEDDAEAKGRRKKATGTSPVPGDRPATAGGEVIDKVP